MFTQPYGVEVSSWVTLDDSCDEISTDVQDDHIEMTFGSHNAFGLVLTGNIVDRLVEELAYARRRLRDGSDARRERRR